MFCFANSYSIVTRGSVSLSCATSVHPSCFSKYTAVVELTWKKIKFQKRLEGNRSKPLTSVEVFLLTTTQTVKKWSTQNTQISYLTEFQVILRYLSIKSKLFLDVKDYNMISEFGRSLFTKYAFSVSRVETVKDWGDTVTALLWLKIL